jgi:hypothetical protein
MKSYNAAVSAHAHCARVLLEATMQGTAAPTELIDAEQRTRQGMEEARQKRCNRYAS